MPDVEAVEALYFPGYEFSSIPWLKVALLYWESILRIVPDGMEPRDTDEVKELIAHGLVQDASVAAFRHDASGTFTSRMEDLLRARDGTLPEPLEKAPEARIHLTQLDTELVSWLRSRNLLAIEGEWARLPAEVAGLYRITLASVVGRQLFVAPVTDDVPCDVAATYFESGRMTEAGGAVPVDGFAWAHLAVPFPSPQVARVLSVKNLLRVRERYAAQRRDFRSKVQTAATAIATLPSAHAIQAHLDALGREIAEDVSVQQQALRAARVREAWTYLQVGAPVSIGTGLSVLGAPPLIVGVGAGGSVALAVTNWLLEHQGERIRRGHYLLSLEDAVSKPDGSRASRAMERFLRAGISRGPQR